MEYKVMFFVFNFFIFSELLLLSATAQTWMRVGYWYSSDSAIPISEINSALFTHLVCAFAPVNSTSYQISFSPSDEEKFSSFSATVKQKNPSVTTLVSIGGYSTNNSVFSSTLSNPSHRKTFIESSIKIARNYGFQGLDLSWPSVNSSSDMYNMGILFGEWRAAVELEARLNSSLSQLILTASVTYTPRKTTGTFPVESMQQYLDWVHIVTTEYFRPRPGKKNITKPHSALYDPTSIRNTDYGITRWINGGLSADKMVFCLPFYGFAWTLENPEDNGIGAPAIGPAFSENGSLPYKFIKNYIEQNKDNNVHVFYNATYVVNYCSVGKIWIGFDDVEAIKAKVSYAKEKKLLGYYVWEVSFDDKWVLSQAAADEEGHKKGRKKLRLLAIVLPVTAAGTLLLAYLLYYWCVKKLKSQGKLGAAAETSKERATNQAADGGDFDRNTPNLRVYSLAEIVAATDQFSIQNKLGQGGYGPVYKGILQDEEEIAVKKLSKTSTQGFEEFKNEVMLTAKLQHVNLVRVLGFCIDREEHMLIYEYMPNKSLDCYIFDPIRRFILDWNKRVDIIEGITQGLLYLQEYSRLTIIHRDLKASNVLLDEDMKPKISDFGMARIFVKDDLEANTKRIVGTIGYIPPEYARRGIYSTKSDVYSFGVLLLQIISGKGLSILYGLNENLSLLDYAYELWKDGRGMEFMDPSLDDTHSPCKLIICLQIALLCVQEKPIDRPSMLEVSLMLKNETPFINTPKKPAFSIQVDEDERKKSPRQFEVCSDNDVAICSVNDVTISEVVGR